MVSRLQRNTKEVGWRKDSRYSADGLRMEIANTCRCYKAQIEADGDVTWDGFTDDNKGISESVQENDGRG